MRNDYNGKKRSELPDSVFGIPQERKYPMPDEKHTRSAIKLFNHVDPKYEEQLAKAVIKNMKKYGIDGSAVGPNNRLRKYLPKDMIKEEYMLEEYLKSDKGLYHLSKTNLDGKTLYPRIPSNFLVKNGYEDGKTERVCFAKSIDGSLRGMSQNLKGVELYVHVPDGQYNIYTPNIKEVPDSKITGEVWIKEPVKLRCIGKIKVIKDKGEDGIPYKYGNNTAELYDWEWRWINTVTNESVSSTVSKDHKQKGYIRLSSLKKVRITEYLINKYKQEYPVLRHVRCKDTDNYVCDGYMWFKDNNLVCYVGSCQYTDDNTKWIVSLEIVPEYRGYGLSSQILDFCVKSMNCKYLSVNKNNELAKRIYDKYGFKVYHEDKTMYYMTLDNISKQTTNESYISEGLFNKTKSIVDIRKDSTKKAKVYLKKNFSRYPVLKKGYFVLDELETDLDEWNDIEYRKKQMYDYYMGYSDRIAIYHNLLTKNYPDAINNKWIYSNVVEPLIKICDEFENTLPGFKLHCSSNKNMTSVLVYVVAKSSTKESSEDIELDKDFLNELNFLTRPSITTDDQKDRTTAYFQANSHVLRFLNTHPDLRKGQIVHSSPNVRLDEYMDPTNKAMIFKNFIEGNRKSIAIYHNMLYSNYGKKGFEWVKENVIKPVNEMCDTFKYNGYELYGSVNEQYTSLLVSLRQKSVKESAISEGLFGKKATDEEMKKAAGEIIDFIKPIVMTPTNKTRAKNIGLKLQCSIENIDKNIVCILILDGPQARRDTDDARSILEDIRYRVKSSLSPLVSKIDMGDGDEGCLYFTVNTKHVRKISESVIHENEISETEIDDIKTVISSLDDDSFNDFKFSDIVYCDIRYRSKKPIAFITIRTKLINNYTVGYVSLAVNPKYQNQGIGKSLTQKAVQWFKRERGIAFLEWHCLPDNEASRKLANSAGFKEYIAKDHNDYIHYTMESVIQDTNIISKNKRTFSPDALDNAIKEYGTTAGTMVGSNQPDSVYIVNYMQNNAFSGHKEPRFGICKKGMKDLHIVGGKYNKFHYVSDLNKFRDESSDIHIYRYKGKPKTSFYDIVREMDDNDLNIYKFITGRDIDDRSSIEFDGDFIEEECFLDEIDAIKACTEAGMLSVVENTCPVPILTEMVQGRPYNYYRDLNGVFIQNEITHIRSKSYDSINEIPDSEIALVKRGYLV